MKKISRWLSLCLLVFALEAGADSFVIADIRVEGLQRISAGSIFSVLPINIGDTTDAQMLRDTASAMFATGNFNDIKLARDGDVLVIQVVERPSISEINLEGNKAIETEALLESAKLLNSRMREVRESGKVLGTERMAVMTALNVIHEFSTRKVTQDGVISSAAAQLERLENKILEAIPRRRPPDAVD